MPPPRDFPENVVTSNSEIDENKERGNWSSGVEFLLSCLSYAVGLGNVWRFPYLCYRNGGGAFLIPYTFMLLFVGLPMFLMELSFGQYASEGPITIWKISPLFQGLGYAMFLMSALVCIYYNMIIAWALFYLFSSFASPLPWSNCENPWNTKACRRFNTKNCTALNGTMLNNGTCLFASSEEEWINYTNLRENSKMASDEYFHNFVLEITGGLEIMGRVRWELATWHKKHRKDTIFIAFGNCATSVYAGFVIFCVIGFMANELGVEVKNVAAQGAGLAFVAYPEAVAKLPLSPLWSILFFTMLLTLGLGTQFTLVETVGGMYVLQLMDNYCASFAALIIGLVEVMVISLVYGVDRFLEDLKVMLGFYPFPKNYWRILWKYISPLIIALILMFSLIDLQPTRYGDYYFPAWATVVGWLLSLASASAIPFVAFLKVSKEKGPIYQRIKKLMQPTEDWGPKLKVHRMEAHSPKHTDSQVPLTSHYDQEEGSNYSGDSKSPSKSGLTNTIDDQIDIEGGLRLNIKNRINESGL
ncbi:hypothetical protein B4U79_04982 [Dinothrombium tinctorium]|uniref:Transporter n=1 Tax=Dinothrombium tinctorium TaxID=1965070 RepID=A0A3S3QQX7_9ACAR|nr:hypothetical protein B4U79_04982 [Dinothrombium tinctorium]